MLLSIGQSILESESLYNPWDSPGQNTGLGSLSLLRDLPNPGIEPRSPSLQVISLPAEPPEKPKNTGVGTLSLLQGDLPDPGIKPGSPAFQADSLLAELPGKPLKCINFLLLVQILSFPQAPFISQTLKLL